MRLDVENCVRELVAFGVAFMRWRVPRVPGGERSRWPVALGLGVTVGVAGFVCAVTLSAIQTLLGWSVEEQEWLVELLRNRDTLARVLPLVVLAAPLAEETFFRGYMFRFLLLRSGTWPAYLLSAGSFSLIHLHLPGIPTYFVVGLLFAWVCRRTSTLVAAVAAHMTYNGTAMLLTLLMPGM